VSVDSEGKKPALEAGNHREFWEQAHQESGDAPVGGYLTQDYPVALARARYAGEWSQVSGWLAKSEIEKKSCLDVGCGDGTWLNRFAESFEKVHGMDISQDAVDKIAARAKKNGQTHISVSCGSVLEHEPQSTTYDLIFVGGVLMYLEDEELNFALSKLRSWLSPGGLLILRESVHREQTWYRDSPLSPGLFTDPDAAPRPYQAIYRPPETLSSALGMTGFEILQMDINRHYKFSDMTETQLMGINRILGGRLRENRKLAEAWAEAIYRWRAFTLFPLYAFKRLLFRRPWKVENYWYLCQSAEQTGEKQP